MFKSVPSLYRDCLRTAQHMAANSAKGRSIRAMVRHEFDKHKGVTDEQQIEQLKKKSAHTSSSSSSSSAPFTAELHSPSAAFLLSTRSAVTALANYLSITSIRYTTQKQ